MRRLVVALAAVIIGLPACGDDDDDDDEVEYIDNSAWNTRTSPSGQAVECLDFGTWGWCRDVVTP